MRCGTSVAQTASSTMKLNVSSNVLLSMTQSIALATAAPLTNATTGVRNRGCNVAICLKNKPSCAALTGARPLTSTHPFSVPSPATIAQMLIIHAPTGPTARSTTIALGRADDATWSFGSTPATTIAAIRKTTVPTTYPIIVPRQIVRVGDCISSAGTVAVSTPL